MYECYKIVTNGKEQMMEKFIRKYMVPRRHTRKENLLSALIGVVMGLTIFCPLFTARAQAEETASESCMTAEVHNFRPSDEAGTQELPETIPVEETAQETPEENIPVQTEEKQEDILATLDPGELDIFARAVEAEAGNQGLYGKQLVADVILNRVTSRDFPDTITDVIMDRNAKGTYQFSVVYDGRINTVTPTEETYEAIRTELTQVQYPSLMYFSAEGYLPYGTPWKQVGGHYFNIG